MKNNKPKSFALNGANDISQYVDKVTVGKSKDMFKFANGVSMGQFGTNVASRIAVDFSKSNSNSVRSLQDVANTQQKLLRDYNDELVRRGIGLSRKDLRKKDTIDIRNLCDYTKSQTGEECRIPNVRTSDISDDFLINTHWYGYVPCFNEGVLQLDSARYVYWKIENIDVQERKMEIYIADYFRSTNIWQVGVSTKVHYVFSEKPMIRDKNESKQLILSVSDYKLFSDLYRLISAEEMCWSKWDTEVWNDIVVAYADSMVEKLENNHGTNNAQELAKIFTHFILLANQQLYANKPKAIRKNPKSKTNIKTEIETGVQQPKKIVRTVGAISMKSEKPPKIPTKETVVKYKTAVWKARGGVRRMKNGKLVPFKESIRHRKCLQDTTDIPQTCINFAPKKK